MVTVKVCIPTSDRLQSHCQKSLDRLLAQSYERYAHVVVHDIYKSCYLYSSRNWLIGGSWCIAEALGNAELFDYYWFIDSDIGGFDYDLLDKMILRQEQVVTVPYEPKERDGNLVAGNIFMPHGGISCMPITYPYPTCDWSGLGCTLFHKSVFTRKLPFPWFEPQIIEYTKDGRSYREVVGEDLAISLALHRQKIPFHIEHWGLIHKVDEPEKCSCGSELPRRCDACVRSDQFQRAQGSL